MKRKQKLDLLRAANSFEAVRPDVRVPIWEPRADFLVENFEPATGFGPQPQSVAFGRSSGESLVRQKRAVMGRDLAFRFASDAKVTEKVSTKFK